MEEEQNNMVLAQMEEDKDKIFEIAKCYKDFSENLKNNKNEKNKVAYLISKESIDIFKSKIKYEETKEYIKDNGNEENLKQFKEKLKDYSLNDLDLILCIDIKLYCNLSEIQEDISKGFNLVDYNFLDKLDFDENFEDYIVHYYKIDNNLMIEFNDKSKLLIEEENGKYKYHVMEAPIIEIDKVIKIVRTKTATCFSNRRSKTRKGEILRHVSKTNYY